MGSNLFHVLMNVAVIPPHLFEALGVIALVENNITHGSVYRLPCEQYEGASLYVRLSHNTPQPSESWNGLIQFPVKH